MQLSLRKTNNLIKKWAKDLNRHLSKEDITDSRQTHEKMLNITHYREMQIKTTIRSHFTLVRMATVKKSTNNRCWRQCGEKGTFHCLWECKLVQPLWRTGWRLPSKLLKIELPYDPAVPLLDKYPDKTIVQKINAPQCS